MSERGVKLWDPSAEAVERSNLTRYMRWLEEARGLDFDANRAVDAAARAAGPARARLDAVPCPVIEALREVITALQRACRRSNRRGLQSG